MTEKKVLRPLLTALNYAYGSFTATQDYSRIRPQATIFDALQLVFTSSTEIEEAEPAKTIYGENPRCCNSKRDYHQSIERWIHT